AALSSPKRIAALRGKYCPVTRKVVDDVGGTARQKTTSTPASGARTATIVGRETCETTPPRARLDHHAVSIADAMHATIVNASIIGPPFGREDGRARVSLPRVAQRCPAREPTCNPQ